MKITSQSVKTFYEIEFDAADLSNAIESYKRSENAQAMWGNAFEGIDTSDLSEAACERLLETKIGWGNGATASFLADYFGFDGWQNSGYYNKKRKTYRMQVFNYGDALNI